MPLKLRLQRQGRKKVPHYLIVAVDGRAARGGEYIEKLGAYNPLTNPATIELDSDKALNWLNMGAQPSPSVKAILTYKGVLYKKHLLRGVKLGKVKPEEVESKFTQWNEEHTARINAKKEKIHKSRKDKLHAKMLDEAKKREEKEQLKAQRKAEAIAAAEAAEKAKAEAAQATEAAKAVSTEPAPPEADAPKAE